MDTFIDIDSLNNVQEVLDVISMYRLIAKNGGHFEDIEFAVNNDVIDDKYSFLEDYILNTFPYYDMYYVNDPLEPCAIAHLFEEVAEYFDPEEATVYGIVFLDYVAEFYKKCKEIDMCVSDTFLTVCVDDFNRSIMQYGDGISYMELFIPIDNIIEETGSPLMLFYTDPSLITYDALSALYDGLDYCKKVASGEIELRKES